MRTIGGEHKVLFESKTKRTKTISFFFKSKYLTRGRQERLLIALADRMTQSSGPWTHPRTPIKIKIKIEIKIKINNITIKINIKIKIKIRNVKYAMVMLKKKRMLMWGRRRSMRKMKMKRM